MKPSALSKRLGNRIDLVRRMVSDARSMIEHYRTEMETYTAKRLEFEKIANRDFSSRLGSPEQTSIFDLSNRSLPVVQNVTRFMKARLAEDLWGSKPYIAVTPAGKLDGPLADEINRHGPWKVDQSDYARHGKEAIGLALDLGEAVLKTSHRHDEDIRESEEFVLVNKATGTPVLVPMSDTAGDPQMDAEQRPIGDYIYEDDPTATDESGRTVFERAPTIAFDDTVEFREVLVENKTVLYHGLDVAVVRFSAFIAPLNLPDLCRAPAVCHEYSRTWHQLRRLYLNPDNAESVALFEALKNEPNGPKTEEDKPRETHGELSAGARTLFAENPDIMVQEIYLRDYDVFDDGTTRNIFLVLAGDMDEPLYYEYLGNITPRAALPFHPVVVNRVPGRWYGRGFYELYQDSQELIDELLNCILYRNEHNADPMTFWQPGAVEEGVKDSRLVRTPGKPYTLRPGKTARDALEIVEWPDLDQRTWELIQLMMQLIQTDSGVTSAAQGDYSALPSASTATGVSSILQSASTLHRNLTEDLRDGFTPAIKFALQVIYSHQDEDETYRYLEGQAAEVLSLASAKSFADLDLNVRVLLTRFQMREQREQAQLVITNVLPVWVQMLQVSGLSTAGVAAASQSLFVQVAKGTDIQQAEEIFAIPAPLPPPPAEPPEASEPQPDDETAEPPPLPSNVIPDAGAGEPMKEHA